MIDFQNGRISISKTIAARPETVWNILTDTHFWPTWGPSLLSVECDDRHIRLGSKGRVKTLFSFWLPFTVTEFKQMYSWSWNIGPVKATGHTLFRENDTSSRLSFDMPWWAAAYVPVCWLALVRIRKIACHNDCS
ncbi:MAG: SRPBCC family protein [Desulforhopalus sp.]